MGRLNKKLVLKTKKASKTKKLSKPDSVEEPLSQPTQPSKLLLDLPLKPAGQTLVQISQVPKNLSKISKKEKRKLKSDHLKKKLNLVASQKQETKDKLKRQKTVITGDLRPIAETLKEVLIEADEIKAQRESQKVVPKKIRQTSKRSQKAMLDDLSVFQQVLKHPEYAKDPFKTISTHIQNKMIMEAMQTGQ